MKKEELEWELSQLTELKSELAKSESDKKNIYDERIKEIKDTLKKMDKETVK